MKEKVKDYFTFSSSERNGILVLIFIILLILLIRFILPYLRHPDESDLDSYKQEIADWKNTFKTANPTTPDLSLQKDKNSNALNLFIFDPNNITMEELKYMGLNPGVCTAWNNYIKNGGKFYKKEDLQKIYGLDTTTYKKLEKYIRFTNEDIAKTINYEPSVTATPLIIEMNLAAEQDLLKLKGIGNVYSKRIIKYRDLLGGYSGLHQLKEVYGLNDSLVNTLEEYVIFNKAMIKKININTAEVETLSSHPYITTYTAKSIIKYRDLMGKFNSTEELLINHLIPDSLYNILSDYLIVK